MRVNVLVIDDDPAIRELVTEVLDEEGYAALSAPQGAAALALMDGRSPDTPDLILLDMRMPVMNGWTFVRKYRQRPGRHAPIVMMTAAHDAAQWASEIEADAVLSKPFDLNDLLTVVAQFARYPGSPISA
jgi:two-component system, chemotaxis family, chemotaxis protein CheY